MTDSADRWFSSYRVTADPRLRLVCFPHAGGTPTAYRTWARRLPEDVEVLATCYPGRQDRYGEPFAESIHELADGITDALAPLLDTPLSLFGHSMGAAVAHEVALRLHDRYGFRPERLFVSGAEAPHRRERTDLLHTLDDESFLDAIRQLGSASLATIEDEALLALVLPAIKADYRLVETYRPASTAKTRSPVVAYVGDQDDNCGIESVRAWSETTAAGFELRVFPGDHFYLEPRERELLAHLAGHLRADMRLREALGSPAAMRGGRSA
ncbi:thioesterase II family protein [Streptomyces sp. NPDC058682]|uniref:thioesterase II family protein n=1 Tax=Streptomyces sp. NPDC058682 TaxID=3346596 RepID=UPI0036686B43